MPQEIMSVLSALGTFLLMIAVFVGAYFVSKWVGKTQHASGGGACSNLKILERIALGKDQALVIASVGGKLLLLGITAQHIEKLEELDPALLVPAEHQETPSISFLSILENLRKRPSGSNAEEEPNDTTK